MKIQTYSGGTYDFEEPTLERSAIFDIAHALSKICRFTGHTKQFYSVAEHSFRVSDAVFSSTGDLRLGYYGLLHDAHEAFVGDISTPLKRLLPDYVRLEEIARCEVSSVFGLGYQVPPIVKLFDSILLATEKRDLLYPSDVWTMGLPEPLEETIIPVDVETARIKFMNSYHYYVRRIDRCY